MKILQIAPAWVNTPPNDYGGTEWVIANLIRGLSGLGHKVTLFATKGSRPASKLEFIFKECLLDQKVPWTAALPALIHYHQAFKRAFKYDLVHAHLSSATDMVILPFLADLHEKGIPSIMTIHSRWPFDITSGMDSLFLRLYAKKILAVNVSASMQKTLPKEFRSGGFVYNSLDISKLKFNPTGGSYLTWLGKMNPEKGIADAIKIAKQAGEQFIFAGIIDRYKERSLTYFETQVKPLIDGRQIKYLGPADLRLKNKLLGGAKAFLNPINWDEPFGMVMVESMACGTPVLSFNRGAAPEVIRDQKTGFLVETPAAMIKALGKIRQINRFACRAHVEKNFSTKTAALKYLRLYQREIKMHQKLENKRLVLPPIKSDQIFIGEYHPNGLVGSAATQTLRKKDILSPFSD